MAAARSLSIAALLALGVGGCLVSFDGYRLDEADAGAGGSAGGAAGTGGTGGSAGAATGGSAGVGASGGSAGVAGSGGTAGASGTGGSAGAAGACPSKAGAALLAIPVLAGGSYCIDKTEVTRDQYYAFLNTANTSNQIPACAGNTTFAPDNTGECQGVVAPATNGDHPIVCVDWCDAYAYCVAVGKRLCGAIGSGSTGAGGLTDAAKSQWFNACSANATLTFPYGDVYEAQRCNGLQAPTVGTAPTGGFPLCQGGYPNLYDMSGNASEWEDGCSGSDCPSRGGSYNEDFDTSPESLKCESAWLVPRTTTSKYRGFRCCWDASVP